MGTLDFFIKHFKIDPTGGPRICIPGCKRKDIAGWLYDLDFRVAVEVGVASGEYTEILCKNNKQMHVYGIDPWIPYPEYTDYSGNEIDGMKGDCMKRLKRYSNYTLIEKLSMDALADFEDDSVDFAYIDANHYEPYVSQDIAGWYKKVKKGGILAGHDFIPGSDVAKAITSFAEKNNIDPWFVLGADEKVDGQRRDRTRSWMLIK